MKTKTTVRQKIVNFLHKHDGKAFPAPALAKRLRLNYNTVRRELGYMYNNFLVEKNRNKGRLEYTAGLI